MSAKALCGDITYPCAECPIKEENGRKSTASCIQCKEVLAAVEAIGGPPSPETMRRIDVIENNARSRPPNIYNRPFR